MKSVLPRAFRIFLAVGLVAAVAPPLIGCGEQVEDSGSHSATGIRPAPPARPMAPRPETFAGGLVSEGALVVTHGGVGSPPTWSAPCRHAASTGLNGGAGALPMATAAVVVLEDHPRFNAGTGANIRLDGRTVQMDAAVMTSDGEFAAVAALERVRNPILVARAVMDTPHRLLAGEGAIRFAHRLGFADEVPKSAQAEQRYRERMLRLLAGEGGGGYDTFDWRAAWNYRDPPPTAADLEERAGGDGAGSADRAPLPPADPIRENSDTVGAVTRAADGTFAAALSTGGTSLTLYGRVGDVPIYACGCYAGPAGAVACTGFGEEIIRRAMARTVYDLMAAGASAQEAVREGVALFGQEYSLGLIAVGATDWAVAANREMAWGYAGP